MNGGLVVPIRCHDGENFPQEAQSVQALDLCDYLSTLPAFWETRRAVELEEKLKEFVQALAKIVEEAPQYKQDWPAFEAEALKDPAIPLRRL